MHKVLRTFTDGVGRVKVGDIVDASQYRNLGRLVRRGYLVPVGDDAEPTPRESPERVEEVTAEEPAEEFPAQVEGKNDELEEPDIEPVIFNNNVDIIDQLASIPDPAAEAKKPVEPKSKPTKKR